MRTILPLFLLALLIGCETPDNAATPAPSAPQQPQAPASRIVAMGDVHGDFQALLRGLRTADIIDAENNWSAGKTTFVQTGDLLDRGDTEREVVDLFLKLRKQAPKVGGRVILLCGNHELMNAMGDLRYVTPGGIGSFDDAVSPADRDRFKGAPKEIRGRLAAWTPGGVYAKRMAADGVIAVVDGNVFVHGGVLPEHATRVNELNEIVKMWLRDSGPMPGEVVTGSRSPVWTRIYSRPQPTPEACTSLSRTLETMNARRMFVGHTPQIKEGPNAACNGRVWRIDTGMSAHYGGQASPVEIIGDQVRVLISDNVDAIHQRTANH